MIRHVKKGRTGKRLLAPAMVVLAASIISPALGAIDGRELVISLQFPSRAAPAQVQQAGEAQLATAASCKADGAAVTVRDANDATTALVGGLSARAAEHGMKLWLAVAMPNQRVPEIARAAASLPVEGLALFFSAPKGDPIEPGNRAALLALKRQGDALGQSIREVKRQLGSRKLAICAPLSAIAPETARGQYVPVGDLVRDGTVDVVALGEAERINFHRLRLLRDAPLRAGCFLDAQPIETSRRAGALSRTVLESVQNDTCQLLWLREFPVEMVAQVAPLAAEGLKQSRKRRAALEAALARGELLVDQEVSEKDGKDQASLHGVAQSFVPSRDGRCPLVQVYAAIRGAKGPLPPPLHVEIRRDDQGKPGAGVLAKADVPAAEFGLEPDYRWGGARFEPLPALKKGETYWIYLTNQAHTDGNYVWRLSRDGAGPRGHAWSKRYDYTKHAWVFRVYLKKEASP